MASQGAIGLSVSSTAARTAVACGERVEVVLDGQGNRETPPYVAFTDSEVLVGRAAKRQAAENPANTVYDVMNIIGRDYSDPVVQASTWPFKVVPKKDGKALIQVRQSGGVKHFLPEQVLAILFAQMKKEAERHLGRECPKAALTVPSNFNDAQREATRAAARAAGILELCIAIEPRAAITAYGLQSPSADAENVLVFDLGARKLDVTLYNVDAGVLEIKAQATDTSLGGEHFTTALIEHCVLTYPRVHEVLKRQGGVDMLRAACEQAKCDLSRQDEAKIEIPSAEFTAIITRNGFDKLLTKHYDSCIGVVKQVLAKENIEATDVDRVVLCGGSMRIPRVRTMIREDLGFKKTSSSIVPDEVSVFGAAKVAALNQGSHGHPPFKMFDAIPLGEVGQTKTGEVLAWNKAHSVGFVRIGDDKVGFQDIRVTATATDGGALLPGAEVTVQMIDQQVIAVTGDGVIELEPQMEPQSFSDTASLYEALKHKRLSVDKECAAVRLQLYPAVLASGRGWDQATPCIITSNELRMKSTKGSWHNLTKNNPLALYTGKDGGGADAVFLRLEVLQHNKHGKVQHRYPFFVTVDKNLAVADDRQTWTKRASDMLRASKPQGRGGSSSTSHSRARSPARDKAPSLPAARSPPQVQKKKTRTAQDPSSPPARVRSRAASDKRTAPRRSQASVGGDSARTKSVAGKKRGRGADAPDGVEQGC